MEELEYNIEETTKDDQTISKVNEKELKKDSKTLTPEERKQNVKLRLSIMLSLVIAAEVALILRALISKIMGV